MTYTAVVGHMGTVYVIHVCNIIDMLAKTESKPFRKQKRKTNKQFLDTTMTLYSVE